MIRPNVKLSNVELHEAMMIRQYDPPDPPMDRTGVVTLIVLALFTAGAWFWVGHAIGMFN